MTANHIVSSVYDKSRISAGIMAIIGRNRAAIYRLRHNTPSPRLGKSFKFPSFVIFFRHKVQIVSNLYFLNVCRFFLKYDLNPKLNIKNINLMPINKSQMIIRRTFCITIINSV